MRRFALAVLLTGALLLPACSQPSTSPYRKPSPDERKELMDLLWQAFHPGVPGVTMNSASVLKSNPAYASVHCSDRGWSDSKTILVHRQGHSWSVAYDFTLPRPVTRSCEFAPAKVLHDLFSISCPPVRKEIRELAAAVDSWNNSYPAAIESVFVSRVNRAWARVEVKTPAADLIFHRRAGRWNAVYLVDGGVPGESSSDFGCAYVPGHVATSGVTALA